MFFLNLQGFYHNKKYYEINIYTFLEGVIYQKQGCYNEDLYSCLHYSQHLELDIG